MFLGAKSSGKHTYLQLIESHRSGTQVRQRVLTTLGRSLADGFPAPVLGPEFVFAPLWRQTGCRDALRTQSDSG